MSLIKAVLASSTATLLVIGAPVAAQVTDADRAMAREVLTELVGYRTAKGQGQVPAMVDALAKRFRAAGFADTDIMRLPIEIDGEQTMGLVVRLAGSDPAARPIAVLGHMDVVDAVAENWGTEPFKPTVKDDGYLYGRGSVDNKAGVSAVATTFMLLKKKGFVPKRDLLIAFSGDEETGMRTTRLLTKHPLVRKAEYALNSDAGGGAVENGVATFGIQSAEKTFATFLISAKNPGGHSSAPGPDNAIFDLTAALTKLSTLKFPVQFNEITRVAAADLAKEKGGEFGTAITALLADPTDAAARKVVEGYPQYSNMLWTTCVPTMLAAGNAANALPQNATATVNCRIFPGTTVAAIKDKLTATIADADMTIVQDGESVESPVSPPREDLFAALRRAVHANYPGAPVTPSMSSGGTDGREFRSVGIPTYGAGSLALKRPEDSRAHGTDERVPLAAFDKELTYWDTLLRDLGSKS